MTARRLETAAKHFAFPLAGAALAAVALFAAPRVATFPDRAAVAAIEAARVAPLLPRPREALPFTMPDVVAYFTGALVTKPEFEAETAVFTGTASQYAEDLFRIAITPEHGALVVAFSGGGDYGLTLAREFFEAPFFTRDETLRFFTLLEESRGGPATAKLGRFTVRFTHLEHSDDFHLTLRFTPRAS